MTHLRSYQFEQQIWTDCQSALLFPHLQKETTAASGGRVQSPCLPRELCCHSCRDGLGQLPSVTSTFRCGVFSPRLEIWSLFMGNSSYLRSRAELPRTELSHFYSHFFFMVTLYLSSSFSLLNSSPSLFVCKDWARIASGDTSTLSAFFNILGM